MTRLARILPAFLAGLTVTLLAVPAMAAPVAVEDILAALSDYEDADLNVEWHNDALVLDGDAPDELIDDIVITAAKASGAKTIVNNLYIS